MAGAPRLEDLITRKHDSISRDLRHRKLGHFPLYWPHFQQLITASTIDDRSAPAIDNRSASIIATQRQLTVAEGM
jgi:hypothetical protein